jgi:hypothetical protein
VATKDQLSPDEALEQMTDESITCRDLAHSWKPWRARMIEGGFERTLKCRTCTTERVELLDSYGRLVRRKYEYADGYIVPGTGRMDADFRAQVRLRSILHTLDAPPPARQRRRLAAAS